MTKKKRIKRINKIFMLLLSLVITLVNVVPVYAAKTNHTYYYDKKDYSYYYDNSFTGNAPMQDSKLIFHFHDKNGKEKTVEYFYNQNANGTNAGYNKTAFYEPDDKNKKILKDNGFDTGVISQLERDNSTGDKLTQTKKKNDFISKFNSTKSKTTKQAHTQKKSYASVDEQGELQKERQEARNESSRRDNGLDIRFSDDNGTGNTCDALIGGDLTKKLNQVLDFIRYLGPILVVVFTTIDFIKTAATGNTDDLNKAGKKFAKRLGAALALFFVVLIVKMLLSVFGITVPQDCLT